MPGAVSLVMLLPAECRSSTLRLAPSRPLKLATDYQLTVRKIGLSVLQLDSGGANAHNILDRASITEFIQYGNHIRAPRKISSSKRHANQIQGTRAPSAGGCGVGQFGFFDLNRYATKVSMKRATRLW